ncbi:class B sortase [Peptoniphilus equinus]|uniref:Class B sortase n=1 Tax=Peptoniphilus equinus TaxID=3016343 RepID=A0ABY7QRE9_9FIRM|nr:class B sortase [Peptoniphilus equinus]WBW49368.1 class B sortase [Peptoniphilus equinus]
MKPSTHRNISILLAAALLAMAAYIEWTRRHDINHNVLTHITETTQHNLDVASLESSKNMYKQEEIARLQTINSDVVGIIDIPNTRIQYPVLQGKDNDYYLKKNINKDNDSKGAIFMDYENDIKHSDNLIIYGHNMLNGTMFSDLANYKDKTYMKANRDIYLYVDDQQILYQVIGAMILNLHTENKVFNFNRYVTFDDTYGAKDYFRDIKKEAMHLIVDDVDNDAQFLTLSTCSYETENARFVVFAVKV